MSYVKAAKELPHMTEDQIDEKAKEYEIVSDDEEAGQLKEAKHGETEGQLATNEGGMMG